MKVIRASFVVTEGRKLADPRIEIAEVRDDFESDLIIESAGRRIVCVYALDATLKSLRERAEAVLESHYRKRESVDTLPDKPSELLRLALRDLEATEKDTRYRVSMGYWHTPDRGEGGNVCLVCAAGAVIGRTLGASPVVRHTPSDFPESVSRKLVAIDRFRLGEIYEGLAVLEIEKRGKLPWDHRQQKVAFYSDDPFAWKEDMRKVIEILESHKL